MKKFLSVLFGSMFLQNAYCDSIRDTNLRSEMVDYLENKLDEKAIQALCDKLYAYALAHNFQVIVEYGDNQIFLPKRSDCTDDNAAVVSAITNEAILQLSKKTFEKHSQSAQDLMKRGAFSHCAGQISSQVTRWKHEGYTVDFDESNTIIDCSETDNRCVVNRPVSKGGVSGYLSVCCSMPVDSYGFTNAQSGYVYIGENYVVDSARTLDDFDYDCKFIDGQ